MAQSSKIEWCDSTFNPWTGCTKVSPGCDHCYAEAMMKRTGRNVWGAGEPRKRTSDKYWDEPLKWNGRDFMRCAACGWRDDRDKFMAQDEDGLRSHCPACGHQWMIATRRRVFCASLADIFDNEVPSEWRADLFDLIARTPNLDWLLLTKRIGNVMPMIPEDWAIRRLPFNVWLGATIVNQEEAERDIPKLLATPARVRFLSMEPLLGPVNLRSCRMTRDQAVAMRLSPHHDRFDPLHPRLPCRPIDWVIAGGESGPGARPMHPAWARWLRDQCADAGVPFLFKQWGEWAQVPYTDARRGWDPASGRQHLFQDGPEDQHTLMERIGKKAAGRLLDGVTHDGFPEVSQ